MIKGVSLGQPLALQNPKSTKLKTFNDTFFKWTENENLQFFKMMILFIHSEMKYS